ncbi:MAG: cupin domain-containing protein [Chitinophagaceae bacterium]|nr:cupin domain-containing protein [Chitinophagaceae bacterium]
MVTPQQLIETYQLQPHPEGGYYTRTYYSHEQIAAAYLPQRFTGDRFISTAIYFLLEGKQFSAFHRIKSDELWHFYAGSGLHIYVIHPDGREELLKLGNDIENGYSFQQVVKAGCWFASKPVDENGFAFAGCTVAPGFDFEDFEMAGKDVLMKEYPQHKEWIEQLCR